MWGRLGRILSKERADPKSMTSIYRTVIQAVLLYGSESWVLTQRMELSLESFHHKCATYIMGQHIRENTDGTWMCPVCSEVLEKSHLLPFQTYIEKRRNTITEYILLRPMYKRCVESIPLARNTNQICLVEASSSAI
jgi:hypothetical protein